MRVHSWMGICLSVVGICLSVTAATNAQTKTLPFNEYEIDPQLHAFDKLDIWNLTLRFKAPRVITVDVPGRGKKIVWYMLYSVVNLSGEPRIFIPDFTLKTNDYETLHPDEVMPAVQEAIRKLEDPTGKLDIQNSVTISKKPIPISKKDAYPRAVNGVAIWTDVYDRAPKTNTFSLFIAGLSDGWKEDPTTKIIRRKTLQINFKRLGDEFHNDPNAIRFVDNPQWIYRQTDADLKGEAAPPPKNKILIEPIKEASFPKPKDDFPVVLPPMIPRDNEILLPPPLKNTDRLPDVKKQ